MTDLAISSHTPPPVNVATNSDRTSQPPKPPENSRAEADTVSLSRQGLELSAQAKAEPAANSSTQQPPDRVAAHTDNRNNADNSAATKTFSSVAKGPNDNNLDILA